MKITELVKIITAEFIHEMYQEDLAEAKRVRQHGCPYCGGALHAANYPRKARGVGVAMPELEQRESFCCSEDGCRKRTTPKSVRFLGRKVYLAIGVIAAAILRSHGATVAKICAAIGMSADTARRWTGWWAGAVQRSRWWQAARALVVPEINGKRLIGELFERFIGQAKSVESAALRLLIYISPLTVSEQYPS